jgi:hypothetical protein
MAAPEVTSFAALWAQRSRDFVSPARKVKEIFNKKFSPARADARVARTQAPASGQFPD